METRVIAFYPVLLGHYDILFVSIRLRSATERIFERMKIDIGYSRSDKRESFDSSVKIHNSSVYICIYNDQMESTLNDDKSPLDDSL